MFKKELYNFENLYTFIQRTCTVSIFLTSYDSKGYGEDIRSHFLLDTFSEAIAMHLYILEIFADQLSE
jgi:hypothetical protein